MIALLANPELIRNYRAQLRPGRMMAVGAICLALSLSAGYAMAQATGADNPPGQWGRWLLYFAVTAQCVALALGGGVACLQSVSREKETNTFDFQRVTRLTPLELALGKLLGAPALTYFVLLSMLPAALVGAVVGNVRPSFLLAAYVILLFGSIVLHALCLMFSMQLTRGLSVAGVLALLYVLGMGSIPDYGFLAVGRLSPFFALDLIEQTSWDLGGEQFDKMGRARLVDVFFGVEVHHAIVLAVLFITFTLWFLLAVARNLKRDPSVYELYSPMQSLGLALYINFLFLGFYQWKKTAPLPAQQTILALNMVLFWILGLVLLRNRDRIRRLARTLGDRASGWLSAAWPAPYLLAGIGLAGFAATALFARGRDPKQEWDLLLALFRVTFLALWIARDVLYLQWINLTRIKRPLVMGWVYLAVFYTCTGILVNTVDVLHSPPVQPVSTIFFPFVFFELNLKSWAAHRASWVLALFAMLLLNALFMFLHRQKLLELAERAPSPAVATSPAD